MLAQRPLREGSQIALLAFFCFSCFGKGALKRFARAAQFAQAFMKIVTTLHPNKQKLLLAEQAAVDLNIRSEHWSQDPCCVLQRANDSNAYLVSAEHAMDAWLVKPANEQQRHLAVIRSIGMILER